MTNFLEVTSFDPLIINAGLPPVGPDGQVLTVVNGVQTWADPTGGSGGGAVTSADITDATTVGREVLTATDATAVRTAISAGTASQGALADSAVQPGDLSPIATTGSADNLADGTTNKVYTAVEKTKLAAITGTNTGDETAATIKSKLGVTTLSGSNTGDQTTITGNAGTATKLLTARAIDGVNFDGTAAISTRLAPTATKTGAYSAAPNDLVPCDATAGTFAVTLPTAPADGTQVAVKKMDNSANDPTVACGGSDVFESGTTSFEIKTQYRSVVFQYHSGTWYTIAMYLSVAALGIPATFADLAGTVAVGQLAAGTTMTQAFTDSNYTTVVRPTNRTDITVMWIGDSTTVSAHLPSNRLTGDIVLTSQA